MFRRLAKILVSDNWTSHVARLLALVGLFLGFYGVAEFKTWFDETIGKSLWTKIAFVSSIHFLVSWLVAGTRIASELEPQLQVAQNDLNTTRSELEAVRSGLKAASPEAAFIEGIKQYVSALSAKGRDQHVLRLREALSRHLWVEGLLRARIALGEAAERAAARLGEEEKQIAALIDDLGWTLVAMDDLPKAAERINLGLRIAQRSNLVYWIAKAHRHLSGIATINRDFPAVVNHLTQSEAAASQITDEARRAEMLAGLKYAQAIAWLFEGKFQDALQMADRSAEIRTTGGDATRIVRTYALKGKILLRIGDATSKGEAKAMFLRGLKEAENIGRRDEILRNLNGLALIADQERDAKGAHDYRARAAELALETPVPYELLDRV